jgi:uncharacterized Tic20 family protein
LLDEGTDVLENDKAIGPETSNMGDLPMSSNPPPDVPPSSPPAATAEAGLPTEIKSEDRTMAMLCHLLGIVSWFLGALIIWLIKKDQSKFVDDQGKEALNFQLTMLIAYVIAAATCFIGIGVFLVPVIGIVDVIFCIIGGIAANQGQYYRYPFALRLIK